MRKLLLLIVMAVVALGATAQRTVQGIPYSNPKVKTSVNNPKPMSTSSSLTFDDILNWSGEGENQAALVIQWNDGTETCAYVYGFRWDGTAYGVDMVKGVVENNPKLYCLVQYTGSMGYTVCGIGYDTDGDGEIGLVDPSTGETLTAENGIIVHPRSGYDYDNWKAVDADDHWASGWYNGYWSYWVRSSSTASFGYSGQGASSRTLTSGCWDGWNFNSKSWLDFVPAPSLIPEGAKTQFKVNGIYYSLKDYAKKTVEVVAPFEIDGVELSSYTGDITIPSTFIDEEITYTVVGIDDDAFVETKIGAVTLPETVTYIGKNAFKNSTLATINITDKITKIGEHAFYGCSSITTYALPASMTAIPAGLYAGTAISSVSLADNITLIGDNAFENCKSLETLSFNAALATIGTSAFSGCSKIESLDIPTSVTAIGASAFAACDGLTSVKVKTITPLTITEDVFSEAAYTNAMLTVPVGYTDVYAAASGWEKFVKVDEVLIPIAEGDCFFVGNVAYTITNYNETDKKVMVTYFPVESVTDSNIKAANALGYVGDVIIPEKVSYQNVEFVVAGVTDKAFMGATEMTSIKFNCEMREIPEYAMDGCKTLATLEIPSTVTSIEQYAFRSCEALSAVTLPQGLLNIGVRAFYNCVALVSVNIPSSLTTMGDYAFAYCEVLKSIEFPEKITTIPASVCYYCSDLSSVKFGSGVTSIGGNAFQYCSSLSTINLPSGLTSLGNSVFASSALESITIPETLTVIPNRVFEKTPLKSVTMSDNVTSLGSYVFNSCTSLKSIKLPSSLSTLGSNAFQKCAALESLSIPGGVTSIPNYMVDGCSMLSSISMGQDVTKIGNYAFRGCSSLKAINLPSAITSIGTYAFQNCTSLETLSIPEGVTAIPNYMAAGCSALASVTYGDITRINNYAFSNTALKILELPATVTTLGSNVVNGSSDVSVYVSSATPISWSYSFNTASGVYAPVYVVYGAKADYEAATGWSNSTINEIIPEMSFDKDNESVTIDYNNVVLSIPVITSDNNNVPVDFWNANVEAVRNVAAVAINFRKVAETEAQSEAKEYTSLDAELQDDGSYKTDLLNYVEANSEYEYYWTLSVGDSYQVVSEKASFETQDLITTGLDSVLDGAKGKTEYYNLQGVKINIAKVNPGIYVKKQGNKAIKVLIK